MSYSSVLRWRMFRLIAWSALPLASFGQNATRIAPVPSDPLELVTGAVPTAAAADQTNALALLGRARDHLALRNSQTAYELKVTFTADSLGRTAYDGRWEMDDVFSPSQGLHWTAKADAGYATSRTSLNGRLQGTGTAGIIPLRLHEARGLLYNPLPSPSYAERGLIRVAAATLQGSALTCLLLSRSRTARPAVGRDWEESEECIDPLTGLLRVHSEVPGRYALYDYTNAPQFDGHVLPRTVTVTEAGRVVSRISVDSLKEIAEPDVSVFWTEDAARPAGPMTAMSGATKISRFHAPSRAGSAMTVDVVCVFGVVTPAGQLVEAHSLQPSDPNSEAAVADAQSIVFSPAAQAEATPHQHFAFVIEKFVTAQQD